MLFIKTFKILVLLSFPFISIGVHAWSSDIHGKITVGAASVLTDIEYEKIRRLGRILADAYPDDFKDWHSRYSKDYSDTEKYIAWLGVWPDYIRGRSLKGSLQKITDKRTLPAHLNYKNTSRWHYDNIFISFKFDKIKRCDKQNNGKLLSVLNSLSNNQRSAIARPISEITLFDAVSVSFFIHLFSDLHQPLHSLSKVEGKKCKHDKGANTFCLVKGTSYKRGKRCEINLHQYWDRAAYAKIKLTDVKESMQPLKLIDVDLNNVDFSAIQQDNLNWRHHVYPSSSNIQSLDELDKTYRSRAQQITSAQIYASARRLALYLSSASK